jgi:hypothetical protein
VIRGSLTPITISLTPFLINRIVLSLKKLADVGSGSGRVWSKGNFSSAEFMSGAMPGGSTTVVSRPPNGGPSEPRLGTDGHNDIPLNELC